MIIAGIIAGLGNPGKQYQNNRHNIGFKIIDNIYAKYQQQHQNPQNHQNPWQNKFSALITRIEINQHTWILAKPQTFMNLCGPAIAQIAKFYKIQPQNTWIIHDELDLPWGQIRSKFNGGSAGHNGLKSISNALTNQFNRIRVGINHPGDKNLVTAHVLGDFNGDEKPSVETLCNAISNNINLALTEQNTEFNQTIQNEIKPQ